MPLTLTNKARELRFDFTRPPRQMQRRRAGQFRQADDAANADFAELPVDRQIKFVKLARPGFQQPMQQKLWNPGIPFYHAENPVP